MSYSAMPPPPPSTGGMPGGPGPRTVPQNVVNAVRLMLVNAALSAIGIIFVFSLRSQLRDQLRADNLNSSAASLDTLVNAAITIAVVVGIIFLVLYVLLAQQVRKGKNWARIVTFVIAGFGVLSALSSLTQDATAINRVLSILQGVIDVVIIVLLTRGDSNNFFRKPSYGPAY